MSTATQATIPSGTATITPDEAAEMFKLATTSATKWAFLDGVAGMVDAQPSLSQREVVDQIGDTATFIAMHGHHRDQGDAGRKASSKLKSIRDELSVVKVWAPADRVEGVSFESHKVLNRLGSSAGKKILNTLVKEMGGPGNVTKSAVVSRLKVADPDHVPQANGKAPAASSTGNHVVTTQMRDMTPLEMATALAEKVTAPDLAKDTSLAAAFEKLADIFEAFSQRKAAKAKAAPAPAAPKSTPSPKAPKRTAPKRPGVKAPSARPSTPRPAVKTPSVKAPA